MNLNKIAVFKKKDVNVRISPQMQGAYTTHPPLFMLNYMHYKDEQSLHCRLTCGYKPYKTAPYNAPTKPLTPIAKRGK